MDEDTIIERNIMRGNHCMDHGEVMQAWGNVSAQVTALNGWMKRIEAGMDKLTVSVDAALSKMHLDEVAFAKLKADVGHIVTRRSKWYGFWFGVLGGTLTIVIGGVALALILWKLPR